MKKLVALGAAGVLVVVMGTSVFAADSVGRYEGAAMGHHRNPAGRINSMIRAMGYCDDYILSDDMIESVGTCVTGYPEECTLSGRICENSGVCVQGCPGGYVDENNNGICDSCEAAGYHGYCDNFVDEDGNGVCDNLHNGYYYGNVDGNRNSGRSSSGYGCGNGGHHSGGHGRGCRR